MLNRLNIIIMSDVLPFNYGMDYDNYLKLWETGGLGELFSDPNKWSQEVIDKVNYFAIKENKLADYLLSLSEEKFHSTIDELQGKSFEQILDLLGI